MTILPEIVYLMGEEKTPREGLPMKYTGMKFTEVLSFRGLESGLLSLRVSCYRIGLGIPSATPNLLSLRGGFTVSHTHFAIP